jgi:hypothetical protein
MLGTAALVIDQAVIVRAARRNEPTSRQVRIVAASPLKLGSGIGYVE